MNKISIFLIAISLVIAFVVVPIKAEGDKVRGDEADGPAYQNGECPFTG